MESKKLERLFEVLIVILYLIVGFVPYFKAIDKIGTQFLYLSILNIVSTTYIFIGQKSASFKLASYPLISLFGLILWSFCSLFYAINKSEVLIDSSRLIVYLFSFVNIYLFTQKNKSLLKYVPYIISIILIFELSFVLFRFYERYTPGSYYRDMGLRAFSGNINITAFNFLLKLPFLLITISRIRFYSIIKILVLSIFSFTLFLLGSRGANLLFIILLLVTVFTSFAFNKESYLFKKHLPVLFISVGIGVAINLFLFESNQNLNVLKRSSDLNTSSTQERLRFYSAAIQSIQENPILGVGIGNWKLHATKYDKPFMQDYTVPYNVHNDFLQVTAELGILGFILFFGIYIYIAYLLLSIIRSKEQLSRELFYILIASSISILAYLSDSFLNFPFNRPLMQIQNLFYIALILIVINEIKPFKTFFKIYIKGLSFSKRVFQFILIYSGLFFAAFISYKVYKSFVDQQFLIAAGNGSFKAYSREYVESFSSKLPSITAATVPIETLKANLIYNLDQTDDTLHFMIAQGKKQNPFLPYSELTKSVLFVRQRNPDSAYVYAKKAFYDLPNHTVHFELLLDIAEVFKDTLEIDKAINTLNDDLRSIFYEQYLSASLRIKNNLGLTESKFLDKYNSLNPESELAKGFNAIFKIGLKNVEDGYYESLKANDFFKEKKYKEAAEAFTKAYEFNPNEISYYENAANSYMQAQDDENAIRILNEVISSLNPTTGKSEYLLGIIYIGQKKYEIGCENLTKSKQKGFNVPDIIFRKFCQLDTEDQ